MLHSLRNLFGYSWTFLVSALGTTTLAICVFSFAVPVLIFLVTLVVKWQSRRKQGASVRQIIKGSLLSWQTKVPFVIYLLVWLCLLGWALSTTAYNDHLALLARIRELRHEKAQVKNESDKTIAKLKGEVSKRQQTVPTSASTQQSPPQTTSTEIKAFPRNMGMDKDGVIVTEITLVPNVAIPPPVVIELDFDFPVLRIITKPLPTPAALLGGGDRWNGLL